MCLEDAGLKEIEALKAQVEIYELFARKVINWNGQFTLEQRCDIGSNGQRDHFISLAENLVIKTPVQCLNKIKADAIDEMVSQCEYKDTMGYLVIESIKIKLKTEALRGKSC